MQQPGEARQEPAEGGVARNDFCNPGSDPGFGTRARNHRHVRRHLLLVDAGSESGHAGTIEGSREFGQVRDAADKDTGR